MSAKKALLAALSAVMALVAFALVVPIETPGLGREVERRVRAATGIELEISRSRLRLLRGLVLEDVRFLAGGCRARFPRMVLEQRPLALLSGLRELKGVRLDEGRIDFEGGSLSIEALGLTVSRLDYDSRALTPLHGISVEGVLDMQRIAFESWELRDLAARISTANGRFRLEDLKLASDRGELSGEFSFDFNTKKK